MGNFSEVAFSEVKEVKEVKTNVSALVIYWFQNTYFFKSVFFYRRTRSTRRL